MGIETAIIGGAVLGGGASMASGIMGSNAAKSSARQTKHAEKRKEAALGIAATQTQAVSDEYINELKAFTSTFNPLDMENNFASLYDSVIAPMERDMNENVMPAIAATYSGFGGGGLSSGAYRETVAKTKMEAAGKKAELRAQERAIGYGRNIDTYNRKVGELTSVAQAKMAPINARVGMATQMYDARQNTIAATLAAKQSVAALPTQIYQGVTSGMQLGSALSSMQSPTVKT